MIDKGVLVAGHDENVSENVLVYWSKYSDQTDYSFDTAKQATINLAAEKSNNSPNKDGRRIVMDLAQNYLGDPSGEAWNYNPEMDLGSIKPETL